MWFEAALPTGYIVRCFKAVLVAIYHLEMKKILISKLISSTNSLQLRILITKLCRAVQIEHFTVRVLDRVSTGR